MCTRRVNSTAPEKFCFSVGAGAGVVAVAELGASPGRDTAGVESTVGAARRRLIAHVTRVDDPRLQHYRHVGHPAWLEAQGLFVAEGRLVLERLIEYGRFAVDSVVLTEGAFRAIEPRLDPSWLVLVADPAIVDGVTGFKFHRGCLALVHRPSRPLPLSAFARARRLILLEAVGNPDNVGGIFRSAAALGADAASTENECRRSAAPAPRPLGDARTAR